MCDAVSSTTQFQNKRNCHARLKRWIICGPRRILNGVVMLNTTLNWGLSRLSSNMGIDCYSESLVKFHNTATIASLRANFAVCRIIESSIKHILYYQSTQRLFSSWNSHRIVELAASHIVNSLLSMSKRFNFLYCRLRSKSVKLDMERRLGIKNCWCCFWCSMVYQYSWCNFCLYERQFYYRWRGIETG